MKKKLGTFLTVFCMCLLFFGTAVQVQAATGKTSVAVSAGTVNIGDTVKITARATGPSGEKTVATMTVSYDTAVFSFVDCSATYGGGGSSVTATSDSFTVTLKAVGAGSCKVAVAASDGVVFDTNQELDSMEGSSTTIKVNNAASEATGSTGTASGTTADNANTTANGNSQNTATENLSADNSLKTLSISPGTLSPAFTGKTVQYTATVANDVTRVAVTATPANEKATVESVTGNENLSVGSNAVKIVVKAENGVTATYTINVTRQETAASSENTDEPDVLTEEPVETTGEAVTIGEVSYSIVDNFSAEQIPAGFSETTINYHGTDYKGVNFEKGNLSMLYLVPVGTADSSAAEFFLYDAAGDGFYPFIQLKHGDNFIIWLPTPAEYTAAEGEQQVEIAVNDGDTMSVHQPAGEENTDFSFFYAVNQDGITGWYQYDAIEQTYQRQNTSFAAAEGETEEEADSNTAYLQEEYTALETEMKKEKSFSRTTIGVLIFIIAVLIVIIINLLLRRRDEMDFEDEDDEDGYEEEPKTKRQPRFARRSMDDLEEGFEEESNVKKTTTVNRRSNDGFGDDLEEPKVKKTSAAARRFTDDFDDDLEEQTKVRKTSTAARRSANDFADDYEEDPKPEKKSRPARRMTDDFADDLEEQPKVRKKPGFVKRESDSFEEDYEESPKRVKKSETRRQEESAGETEIHETVTRSKDGIEVIDFNDL